MPTPREAFAVGVVNGILYGMGGYSRSTGYVGTIEAFDPPTNTPDPRK
jgi:Kelch motif protein